MTLTLIRERSQVGMSEEFQRAHAVEPTEPSTFAKDRQQIEALAMAKVIEMEQGLGRFPRDVHEENRGYDIESSIPKTGGTLASQRPYPFASSAGMPCRRRSNRWYSAKTSNRRMACFGRSISTPFLGDSRHTGSARCTMREVYPASATLATRRMPPASCHLPAASRLLPPALCLLPPATACLTSFRLTANSYNRIT